MTLNNPEHASDPIALQLRRITNALGGLGALGAEQLPLSGLPVAETPDIPMAEAQLLDFTNRPAARICDILADPSERVRRQEVPFQSIVRPADSNTPAVIAVSNEWEALQDFDDKLRELAGILRTSADGNLDIRLAAEADELRTNLRFIGSHEFDEGTRAMAARWHNFATTSSSEVLLVLSEQGDSSQFVVDAVRGHLEREQPETAARMRAISFLDLFKPEVFELFRKDGLTIMDDWVVSGNQLDEMLFNLYRRSRLVLPHKIRLDYICASEETAKYGKRRMGDAAIVPVTASYVFPQSLVGKANFGTAVTGAHASPWWGFRFTVEKLFLHARDKDGHEKLPFPLIYSPRKPYSREGTY